MKPKSNQAAGATEPAGRLPFSRVIAVDTIPDHGLDIAIEADADERAALAARDGLVSIGKLEARFHVAHRPRKGFNVSGRVTALITQICVVSLEPFETAVTENVDVDFAPAEAPAAGHDGGALRDRVSSFDEDQDPPDPIVDGKIDLGALAGEFLALGLDPYPKKTRRAVRRNPDWGTRG